MISSVCLNRFGTTVLPSIQSVSVRLVVLVAVGIGIGIGLGIGVCLDLECIYQM